MYGACSSTLKALVAQLKSLQSEPKESTYPLQTNTFLLLRFSLLSFNGQNAHSACCCLMTHDTPMLVMCGASEQVCVWVVEAEGCEKKAF